MAPAHSNGPSGTPPAEIDIDRTLVRELLNQQHPDLADLPVEFQQEGWDNAIFRLGEDLALRLPRRQAAADLIVNEQRWLPGLKDRLSIPIPVPRRTGRPAPGYPWAWSIIPWFPGLPADETPPSPDQAPIFAAFLNALHQPAPPDAPLNPFRGVPLRDRVAALEPRLQRLEANTTLITPEIKRLWKQNIEVPIDTKSTWIHGDLHARNVLVEQGKITAVIDWGDITSGDPATDLASVWMIFPDREARQAIRAALPHISGETWQRACGWAILFAVILLDTGLVNHPGNAEIGRMTLQRLVADQHHL